MHRIFIYGTLKANEMNAVHMTDESHGKAVFVGKGVTSKKYPLVLVAYKEYRNVPAIIYKEGVGHCIEGEIWDIDDDFLKFLDEFEGYPVMYGRETLQITRIDNSGEETCDVYVQYNDENYDSSNCYSNYSGAERGVPYIVT